jgi:hypothetical protein
MDEESLILFVATYPGVSKALCDYRHLAEARRSGRLDVDGAVILSRAGTGQVTVAETGNGLPRSEPFLHRGTAMVAGLFAPSILLATAVHAGVDAGMTELVKKHDEEMMGFAVDEYLALGSAAIVVLCGYRYLAGIERAVSGGTKSSSTAIYWKDYDTIDRMLSQVRLCGAASGRRDCRRE